MPNIKDILLFLFIFYSIFFCIQIVYLILAYILVKDNLYIYVIAKAAYNSAAYDTRQNAYAQPTYPTQPQYAPYQVSIIQHV